MITVDRRSDVNYGYHMAEVVASTAFTKWLSGLRDRKGRAIILRRIDRLAEGNAGDVKPVGGGVSELRIGFGPGYRVYFREHAGVLIMLLAGGDKSSQAADIAQARAMEWE